MATRQFIPCAHCSAIFKPRKDSERYCCRSCYESSRALPAIGCAHCGASYVKKANHKGSKFCSDDCFVASRRVKPHTCVTCGTLFTPVKYRPSVARMVAYTGRHNCSKLCIDEWKAKTRSEYMRANRDKFSGANSWNWKGACLRRNKSYRGPDWTEIAAKARARDRNICQNCGMTHEQHSERWKQALEVHHIVPFYEFTDHKKANRSSNLVTLCKSCHAAADRAIRARQVLMDFGDEPRKKSSARRCVGQDNPRARLKTNDVLQIKQLLAVHTPQKEIAALFGISSQLVSAINTGAAWAHLKAARPLVSS